MFGKYMPTKKSDCYKYGGGGELMKTEQKGKKFIEQK